MRKICILVLFLFCGNFLRAQVNQSVQDTTKTQFSVGKVELKNPPSILSAYKYDPVTDRLFIPILSMVFRLIIPLF
jgi:hypothetical protein